MPFGVDPFAKDRAILDKQAFGPTKGPALAGDHHCGVRRSRVSRLQTGAAGDREADEQRAQGQAHLPELPTGKIHPWAEKASAYVDCIDRENNDAAWKFIASVYEQQDTVNQQNEAGAAALTNKLNELAAGAGVDAKKVAACTDSAETKQRLERSRKVGEEVEIAATPLYSSTDAAWETLPACRRKC